MRQLSRCAPDWGWARKDAHDIGAAQLVELQGVYPLESRVAYYFVQAVANESSLGFFMIGPPKGRIN